MRFQQLYQDWQDRRLSQSEAAHILGVCERSFRRYIARYEDCEGDLQSISDRRLSVSSKRKAADTEVAALLALYQRSYTGWSAKHFHSHYQRHCTGTGEASRSYSWVKLPCKTLA